MNYAYNPSSFSGLNLGNWSNAVAGFSPFTQGFFNLQPDVAFQSFIDALRPSNASEDLLRRMFPNIVNQWTASQATGGLSNAQSFSDYLSNYDFNRAFASVNPTARRMYSSNFNRPVRTVTF